MKRFIAFSLLLISYFNFAQDKQPKLVVGIVIDQMRDEYLDRFYDDFSDDGFKKLMHEGFRVRNMHYNYMPTFTGPGHASVYTGTTPAYHGIVANDWYHRQLNKSVYCAEDASVSGLGTMKKESEGQMSPSKLKATTITDEVKLSTNFKGKVIGMSIKDRGAILPAGHFADWAFWMSDNGNFISSTFYGNELPKWVNQFNQKKHYETYLNNGWQLLKDEKEYNESLPDKNEYEGKLNYDIEPVFPYDFKEYYKKNGAKIIKYTPGANTMLADLAKLAVKNENLGQDNITDFLAVSFSSPDYIGHVAGPRSMELQDMYLRLDLTIANFIAYLDKNVGKGNYTVFLTADHACGENPTHLKHHKYKISNLNRWDIKKELQTFSTQKYGKDLVLEWDNQNLYLDTQTIESDELDIESIEKDFIHFLLQKPYVKRALSEDELLNASDNFLVQMMANGYDNKQNGQIVVLYEPGYMEYGTTGTTHGTPYAYDTHVPMLFYGAQIKKGESFKKHYITEIAPTISQLLHFTIPNATQANLIEEVLEK